MATTYTSTQNSIIGSDYIGGLVSGLEDYIVIPISNYKTVVLQGDFDKTTTAGTLNFEGERWIISRDDYYNAQYTNDVQCTVNITNPYYCRGSLDDMSVLSTRRDNVAGNFAVISILWGVTICVALWELLRSCVRSRY